MADMHYPMEIMKRFLFEASHDLPQMPEGHKCKRHHGHSYEVQVSLADVELDADGFVLDFGVLGQVVKRYIEDHLDHRDLSEVFGGENTTAERLAVILFYIFRPKLPQLVQLAVKETANTCAKFRPQVPAGAADYERLYWLQRAGIEEAEFLGFPQLDVK